MNLVRVATAHGPRHADLQDGQLLWLTGDWALGFRPTGERAALGDTRLLAPVTPSKVVAVARNYAQHAAEMGAEMPDEPRIFLKPSTSVVGPGDAVAIPPRTTRVDPEGELGVVIGRTLTRGTRDTVMDAVFGYTIVNDVTARDFQKKDGIFGRAKGFDTFCPIGPSVVTGLDARDGGEVCRQGISRRDRRFQRHPTQRRGEAIIRVNRIARALRVSLLEEITIVLIDNTADPFCAQRC